MCFKIFFKGSTVEYFITVGMFKTFGIFFVEYQRKYSTTSSVISLVLAVQTIVGSVSCKLDISDREDGPMDRFYFHVSILKILT